MAEYTVIIICSLITLWNLHNELCVCIILLKALAIVSTGGTDFSYFQLDTLPKREQCHNNG